MVIKSRFSVPIPQVSVPTYIFESPTAPLPNQPAYISCESPEKYQISLPEYRLYAQRFASGLRRMGLQPGERVLLFSGNTLFFPSVVMGIIMAEGIFTGANPTYVARELAYQLKDSGARYLLCAENGLDTGIAAAKEAGMAASQIFVFDDGIATFEGRKVERSTELGHIRHWTELLDDAERGAAYAWPELKTKEELDRVVILNYSSGTTGVAKGVMITHRNHIANCVQILHVNSQRQNYEESQKRARQLCLLPMYHAYAQSVFAISAPKQRVPVYMLAKFDLLQMLECVQKFRITDLALVPPVVVGMAKHPVTKKFDLSSVEHAGCGAAPLGREISVEFEQLWSGGAVNLKQGWGMTELTCAGTIWGPNRRSTNASVGEILPNCEMKIVLDEAGVVEAPQGERGEIWIRGPNVMKGYWNKPDATKETLTEDGWLKTGDVAYVNADNYLFIVDRKKELIKVKGLQVAPAELEALLLDHPDVQDVAVIGVTANDTELPRAYIVLKTADKKTAATAEKIKSWLAERVSKFKRLEGGVHFVDTIPKNPTGKILRRELREMAAQENTRAKL
ncbi:4-coumarate-CoA ligase 2 [Pyrenophora tritici-repentis]|uniref:CaiC, Acyl-CoA synthetase (AMP-forming)-AMP-acid ligase II n=1 Tax=Pyrenophora tritici-repentis TaxID=45151 RepID=A0A2W1HQD8_9PLEO|nr:4-coumarate-CoA ligase 2 [Pyrenophora tritici-repentis]KAF7451001.1 4-coumarate-CoA ligase 2 [Pyrenophora tritici-repentis]KAF7573681.1 CaiC, Acyl-CoA synthetase (AMP-forming)-AMP-acid ligase II [Pyrenophora tritici-repentis]KAG9380787.1 4-coumarate-CoA ligase 2 [Pyrenophora tritici-repentis]KAI0582869.1 4-coumarate-CoA ligase 2 [Pyrenophora tritici-repentis]